MFQLHSSLFCFRSDILHPSLNVTVNSRDSFLPFYPIERGRDISKGGFFFVIFLQPFWCSTCTHFKVYLFLVNTDVYSLMVISSAADGSRIVNLRFLRSHFLLSCCVKVSHYQQFSNYLHNFPTRCIRKRSAKYLQVYKVEIQDSQNDVTEVPCLLGSYTLLISK